MANLLLDLNALLITAQDSGPDAFTAGKDIFACVASMGLNNQVDATAAGDLIKLAADLNKSAADIKADGGPADIQKFLTEVASVLNWVGTNGPGCFQAFMNLYGVFTTGGMSGVSTRLALVVSVRSSRQSIALLPFRIRLLHLPRLLSPALSPFRMWWVNWWLMLRLLWSLLVLHSVQKQTLPVRLWV